MKHVVLLHGLGSHGITMRFLKAYMELFLDYQTHSFSYYSITSNIDSITSFLENKFNSKFTSLDEVFIIGHSLGGIIAAKLASSSQIRCKVSKIITLGTPHTGAIFASRIIDKLPYLSNLFPIIEELSYDSSELAYTIKGDCKVGVIAGNKHSSVWNPLIILGKAFLGSDHVHDGVVGLKENETICDDFICLHVDHVNLLWSKAVAKQCISFIETSNFK
jgi:pimeloyl-ACP methyl ester carboxylesterase